MFQTPEAAELHERIKAWSHSEYPFLDPWYSVGSFMPADDFTLSVAKWIMEEKWTAIAEIWNLLTYSSPASQHLLKTSLAARVPAIIGAGPEAVAELRAVYLLVMRAKYIHFNFSELTAARIMAATLSCYPLMILSVDVPELIRHVASCSKDGLLHNVLGAEGAARQCIQVAAAPFAEARQAADQLREVAPITRLVVHDFLYRGWGNGRLRFGLYYDERLYGCSEAHNKIEIDRLGFFGPPGDDAIVPGSVTKAILRGELEAAGFLMPASETRKKMIELARDVPGMISSIILKWDSGRRSLTPSWGGTVKEWAASVRSLEPLATFILTEMGMQSLRVGA
jgi:hypothetical protein